MAAAPGLMGFALLISLTCHSLGSRVRNLFSLPKKGEALAAPESFTAGEISGMDTVSWQEKREEKGSVETCRHNS